MKQAFTLIELLVVVLIIGILASIALPAYQTAVNKSRYAGLMPLARSVKDAEEDIIMSKGDYTADLQDLSVQVPGTVSGNTANTGNVTLTVVAGAEAGQDYVKAVDSRNTDNTFVMYFAKSPKYPGEIHCEALTANTKAQQLCQSYGPVGTVTGTDNTYTTYVLQGTGADAGGSGGGGTNSSAQASYAIASSLYTALVNMEDGMDVEDICGLAGIECPDGEYTDENGIRFEIGVDSSGNGLIEAYYGWDLAATIDPNGKSQHAFASYIGCRHGCTAEDIYDHLDEIRFFGQALGMNEAEINSSIEEMIASTIPPDYDEEDYGDK